MPSEGVAVAPEHAANREEDDLDVEHKSPVFDVEQVYAHPVLHQLRVGGFAAVAFYLGQTRNTGLHHVTFIVSFNDGPEVFVEFDRVRPGAYHRHLAEEHVEELGHFVQVCFPENPTDAGNAVVVTGSLFEVVPVVDVHAPEFEAPEVLIVAARTLLPEEDRPSRINLNQEGNDGEQPRKHKHDDQEGKQDVEGSLGYLVKYVIQRYFAEGKHREVIVEVNFDFAVIDLPEVRDNFYVNMVFLGEVKQIVYLAVVHFSHGAINLVYLIRQYIFLYIGNLASQVFCIGRPVVEEAQELVSVLWIDAEELLELVGNFADAYNHDPAAVAPCHPEHSEEFDAAQSPGNYGGGGKQICYNQVLTRVVVTLDGDNKGRKERNVEEKELDKIQRNVRVPGYPANVVNS